MGSLKAAPPRRRLGWFPGGEVVHRVEEVDEKTTRFGFGRRLSEALMTRVLVSV